MTLRCVLSPPNLIHQQCHPPRTQTTQAVGAQRVFSIGPICDRIRDQMAEKL